jgi:toxin-antitoxin system PIN domain toxin
VNVYVHAFREAAPDHDRYRDWLRAALVGDQPVGVSDLVLSGFVRVVTHPRVFDPPDAVESALAFADAVRAQPSAIPVTPGDRHWAIFGNLCRTAEARGNLIPDAYLAALAIESGAEFITADRDFSRFEGLRWRHPLRPR